MTTTTFDARGWLIEIDYTSYLGEHSSRKVRPIEFYFGRTESYPVNQWLMLAWDVAKNAERTFAMKDIHLWRRLNDDGV